MSGKLEDKRWAKKVTILNTDCAPLELAAVCGVQVTHPSPLHH